MRFLSVCSGIEAASVAWHPLGFEAVAFSEIEPFPSAVLADRWPGVPNLGDMTKFQQWPNYAINILVGGTPCQSFSVAGLRKGLADPRGNLALTFLAIAARYRPEWILWENVPGVLSDAGNAFGCFLAGLAELGYGFAYRVLDAQHFGIPQRRRRVFVVGHLGDWRRAAAVLFERHSLQGHHPPRREAGQRVAPTVEARTNGGGGGWGTDFMTGGGLAEWPAQIAPTLNAHFGDKQGLEDQHVNGGCGLFVAHSLRGEGFDASEDGTGRGTPLVPVAIQAGALRENPESGPDGVGVRADGVAYTLEARAEVQAVCFSSKDHGADAGAIAPTLRSMGHDGSHANGGGQIAIAFDTTQITSKANRCNPQAGDPCHPLAAGAHPPALAFQTRIARNGRGQPSEIVPALNGSDAGETSDMRPCVATASAVRRLTPRECERLQGFPDDYTLITVRGKPAADGPRYKALGNSMAVPVIRWLGQRLQAVHAREDVRDGHSTRRTRSAPQGAPK